MTTGALQPPRTGWDEVVRRARRNARMTQSDLASRAQVSLKTITNLETGTMPTPRTLTKVRDALGLPEDLSEAQYAVIGIPAGVVAEASSHDMAERIALLEKRVARLEQALMVAAHAYRGMSVAMPELDDEPDSRQRTSSPRGR